MNNNFFRFPHTPHLIWLGEGQPRDDKILSSNAATELLAGEVVVEEKVDGANIGFSTSDGCELLVQSRGDWLQPKHTSPQFRPLWAWLAARKSALLSALYPDLILFGEWCYAQHSINYMALPDWFLGFDVYDQHTANFWEPKRRDELLKQINLFSVPTITTGHFTVSSLSALLVASSGLGHESLEGIVIRQTKNGYTRNRAKLVHPNFTQTITTHWSRRSIVRNKLVNNECKS